MMIERRASRLLTADEAGQRLGLAPRSLLDRRFRLRLGLHGVKLGRRVLRFDESELEDLIARGREHLPGEGRRWANVLLARCYAFVYVSLCDALTPDLSTLRFLLRLIASALCWSCFHDCL